jgi:hypothetical protein
MQGVFDGNPEQIQESLAGSGEVLVKQGSNSQFVFWHGVLVAFALQESVFVQDFENDGG